jgi:hypothetical protein
MATRNGVLSDVSELGTVKLVTWSGLLNGDDGAAAQWCDYADRCIQVTGTFGTGGSLTIQGSNDGANWGALADPQGNALTFTASKLEQALELPRYVRPIVTAGDGTTNLVCTIMMRRGFK